MSNLNNETANTAEAPPSQLPVPVGKKESRPIATLQLHPGPVHRPGHSASGKQALNAISLLKALRRRWLIATTLGVLLGAAVAAAIWFFLPPAPHTATTRLYMPKKPEQYILYGHPEDYHDFNSFQQTQVALLKSRLVLNTALRNPKTAKVNLDSVRKNLTALDWLEREVKVTLPDGPELPRISLSGHDPEQMKILLTAIIDAYLSEIVDLQTKRRSQRLDQLKELATKYKDQLKRLTTNRNEVLKALNAGAGRPLELKQEMAQKQLGLAQGEMIKVDADLRRLEIEAKTYQANANAEGEIPDSYIDAAIEKSLGAEVSARAQIDARLAATRKVLTNEDHPKIQQLLADIESHNKLLDTRRKELRPRYKDDLRDKFKSEAQLHLAQLHDQIRFYREFKGTLTTEIERLDGEAQKITRNAIDLDAFKIDIQLAESGVERVLAAIDKLTVELPDPPRVAQLDKEDPVTTVSPDEQARKVKMAGMGGGGTFAFVLLFIAWLEFRFHRIDSFEQVGQELGVPVVGNLPAPRRSVRQILLSQSGDVGPWQALLAESVNSVRCLLLQLMQSETPRVLMVTSATSGEGKTSLASQLAASLARAGYDTLLLDGDLRKPALHRVFDLPDQPGFSEILRGEVELAQAIHATALPGLSLMPAGDCDDATLELLARGGVPTLLDRLKQDYDFIVVDTSPVLPVADSLLLAQHVDGVLFSLFHEVSRWPSVSAAYHRLRMIGAPILGVVVNGTHADANDYRGYAPKGTAQS